MITVSCLSIEPETIAPAKAAKAKRRMARPPADEAHVGSAGDSSAASTTAPEPRACTKIANVIALLEREQGATMPELIEATAWLPHTTRAALTGLKKKGHTIAKSKRETDTCYNIARGSE